MRGRRPKLDNVVPMRGDDPANAEAQRKAAMRRAVNRLRPKGLSPELRKEWNRVALLLADPIVDRLKPRFVDTIFEYCIACLKLRQYRAKLQEMAEEAARQTGQPVDYVGAEFYRIKGRNGEQMKTLGVVPQIHEVWREWRSLVAMLGLSPADERNMVPGQGDLFDEADREFA